MDKAGDARVSRSVATSNGATQVTEDWTLAAGSAHAALHVKYTRLPANHGSGSVNFYNPADPKTYQIFRSDQSPTSPAMSPPHRRTGCWNFPIRQAAENSQPCLTARKSR